MAISVEPGKGKTFMVPDYEGQREKVKEGVIALLDMVQPLCTHIIIHNNTKHALVTLAFNEGNLHVTVTNEKQDERFDLGL